MDKNCPWGFPKRNGDNGKRVRDIGDIYDNYGIKILMILTLFMTYSWFRWGNSLTRSWTIKLTNVNTPIGHEFLQFY